MKASSGKLTMYILLAMALGITVGYIIHENSTPDTIKSFAANIKLLTTIFLRLVQMVIAPLVFTTLVVGIAKLGDLSAVGRVGGKPSFGLFLHHWPVCCWGCCWLISSSLAPPSTLERQTQKGPKT